MRAATSQLFRIYAEGKAKDPELLGRVGGIASEVIDDIAIVLLEGSLYIIPSAYIHQSRDMESNLHHQPCPTGDGSRAHHTPRYRGRPHGRHSDRTRGYHTGR